MADSFNEFNKKLNKHVSDPGLRYLFGLMYERQVDLSQQNDMMAKVLLDMVTNVNAVVKMQGMQTQDIAGFQKMLKGEVNGVSVSSESIVDEPEER